MSHVTTFRHFPADMFPTAEMFAAGVRGAVGLGFIETTGQRTLPVENFAAQWLLLPVIHIRLAEESGATTSILEGWKAEIVSRAQPT